MRIRTIKPGFWASPILAKLDDSARLAAIGLLNIADDEGYFLAEPPIVRAALWPFDDDSSKARQAISELVRVGYIEIRETIGLVVSFRENQAVDRPKPSMLKKFFVDKPLNVEDSTSDRRAIVEQSTNLPDPDVLMPEPEAPKRKKRKGMVKVVPAITLTTPPIESTAIAVPATAIAVIEPAPVVEDPPKEPKTAATWRAYSQAYEERYHVPPVRNASVNAQIAMFITRVGLEEAPKIAEFYIWTGTQFYVQKGHPVSLMLKDAESLRTQWATGRVTTHTQARQTDQTAARGVVFQKLLQEATDGIQKVD